MVPDFPPNGKHSEVRSDSPWEQMSHMRATWMGGILFCGDKGLQFPHQSHKVYFSADFSLTWLYMATCNKKISNFNFILFSWHISEVVRELQEKSSQGSLAVLCALFVKCKSLILVLIFHIYSRPLPSKCLSALRLKRCVNKQPCPWVLRVFSRTLPRKEP